MKVLDMSGRIIKQVQVKSVAGMNNIAISLGEFTSGLYTIQVYENNKLMQTSKVRKNN
ncbi:MAG: T9SS type A sorting domain-containing protein [Bacteroidetes bacterium]|nr:T9SS type A sorting domain-containing protein [Bacteroidota bacterium]